MLAGPRITAEQVAQTPAPIVAHTINSLYQACAALQEEIQILKAKVQLWQQVATVSQELATRSQHLVSRSGQQLKDGLKHAHSMVEQAISLVPLETIQELPNPPVDEQPFSVYTANNAYLQDFGKRLDELDQIRLIPSPIRRATTADLSVSYRQQEQLDQDTFDPFHFECRQPYVSPERFAFELDGEQY